ncbi:MAG: polysaccharide deacetylase family protein, partial [Candidatus Pacebacteria bacterium]|nr:polysaccharide deacetylase family protein [Candidatus Paceibacterota bacterium]
NGLCGSANGQSFTSAPTSNLCASGTASAISGTGPWTWTCNGSTGGTNASCSAKKIIPDTTPPTVSITSPTGGTIVSGAINLTANATDNIKVIGVQFLIDGVNVGAEDTVSPYQISFDTQTLQNGAHTVSAKARDGAGNTAASAAISINIANTIPQPGDNLIQNPGLENSDASNNPIGWQKGNWGTNTAVFTYPVAGYNSPKAAKIELTQYTDGDAKWYFTDVPVTAGQIYKFSDSYQSNAPSVLTIRFALSNNTFQYVDLGNLGASANWNNFEKTFTVPANCVSITVFHLIRSAGYLAVDNFYLGKTSAPGVLAQGMVSLNFDDGWLSAYNNGLPILNAAGLKSTQYIITSGLTDPENYINQSQVLSLQAAGHEIGAHSQTHAHLTQVSAAQLQNEINGSKQELLNIGVNQVLTFAYPYGEANNAVITTTKNSGFIGARGVDADYNNKTTDPYFLLSQSVESNTTIETIKGWIDTAIQNKTWVILVFHQVDHSGEQYSTTPEILQQIADYLIAKNVSVVTNAAGLQILSQQ